MSLPPAVPFCRVLCATGSGRFPRVSRFSLQPFEKLNLACVVDIVETHAVNESHDACAADRSRLMLRRANQSANGFAHLPVFLLEQTDVAPPSLFRKRDRSTEPITSFVEERPLLVSAQPSANGVFPVRCVYYDFPDVVSARRWSPRCFSRRKASNGPLEVGAVPCFLGVGLIDDLEQ